MVLPDEAANAELPDENRIRLPPRWKPVALPRRGAASRKRVTIDDSASGLLREMIAAVETNLRAALEKPENQEYEEAGLAYLAGHPDPFGAGIVRALLSSEENIKFTASVHYGGKLELRPYFDAWATDHGTEFAFRGIVEAMGVAGAAPFERGRTRALTVSKAELHEPDLRYWGDLDEDFLRLRSLLASAPETEYDALVRALAEHRDSPLKRIATACLMPEQHSWVERAFEEHRAPTLDRWLLAMITGADRLAASGRTRLGSECITKPRLAALVDDFGTASLPVLRSTLESCGDVSMRQLLLTAISVVPSDDAADILLGELATIEGMNTALETATRFPVRTLRAIASAAPAAAREHRVDLGRVVRSAPVLLQEALPRLGDKEQASIADLLDGLDLAPDAAADAIPLPLTASARSDSAVAAWARPVLLPQVLLRGGEAALPLDAVEALLAALVDAGRHRPGTGIDTVRRQCDRASLARFSWALFERWLTVGAPSKDRWAFSQLRHFADDDMVARLTPMISAWPGQSQHQRAVHGLGVLGAIGSETALRALHGIAQKGRFRALRIEAGHQMDAVAAGLGLSAEQLGDRLVPDFGLGDASGTVLDYGPRRFTIGLDEQLKPFVTDADGKRRKSLPKPGVRDDAETAGTAYQRYSQLKKDLRTVASDQIKRLEQAMVAGRTWSKAEFEQYFVGHALMRHPARRLVWLAETDGEQAAFRLAEDQTCTDVDDDRFELPADCVIGLPHPLHIGGSLERWSELFADYELLQPFEQLARPVMAFTDEELATGRIERFEGVTVASGSLLGLEKHGWERADPVDNGAQPGIGYRLPDGGYLCVQLHPGFTIGIPTHFPEQTLTSVKLSDTEDFGWSRRSGTRPHPTDIDPVTASEILLGLARVTAA